MLVNPSGKRDESILEVALVDIPSPERQTLKTLDPVFTKEPTWVF